MTTQTKKAGSKKSGARKRKPPQPQPCPIGTQVNVTRDEGEEEQDYLLRLSEALDDLPAADYDALTDEAAKWHEASVEAYNLDNDLPPVSDFAGPPEVEVADVDPGASAPTTSQAPKERTRTKTKGAVLNKLSREERKAARKGGEAAGRPGRPTGSRAANGHGEVIRRTIIEVLMRDINAPKEALYAALRAAKVEFKENTAYTTAYHARCVLRSLQELGLLSQPLGEGEATAKAEASTSRKKASTSRKKASTSRKKASPSKAAKRKGNKRKAV